MCRAQAPSLEQQVLHRYQNQKFSVLGLDMYNGNHTQLSLFQSSTGVSFPLLQMAVNGTLYGAFRDEMMLIDQTGTQTLLVDVRREPDWRTRVTAEIDRLLSLPVARPLTQEIELDEVPVGDALTFSVDVLNEGNSPLTITGATSDIDTFEFVNASQSAQDTTSVVLRFTPATLGNYTGTVSIATPGAVSDEVVISVRGNVLDPRRPRLATQVTDVSLGDLESGRTGSFFITLDNDGDAELSVGVSERSVGITNSGETLIPAGESGRASYRIDLEEDGPYAGP